MDPETVSLAKYEDLQRLLDAANKRAEKAEKDYAKAQKTWETERTALEGRAVKAEEALSTAEIGHAMDRALLAEGITDPDQIEYIRHKYDTRKVEEGAEKPSFADHWKEVGAATRKLFGLADPAAGAKKGGKPADPKGADPAKGKGAKTDPAKGAEDEPEGAAGKKGDGSAVDPSAGAGRKAPGINSNLTPTELARLNPKDAVKHLRDIGLVGPAKGGAAEADDA